MLGRADTEYPVELGGTPPATTGHSEYAPVSTRKGQGGQVRSFYLNLVVVMTKILGKFVLPRSRPGGWGGEERLKLFANLKVRSGGNL